MVELNSDAVIFFSFPRLRDNSKSRMCTNDGALHFSFPAMAKIHGQAAFRYDEWIISLFATCAANLSRSGEAPLEAPVARVIVDRACLRH